MTNYPLRAHVVRLLAAVRHMTMIDASIYVAHETDDKTVEGWIIPLEYTYRATYGRDFTS